MNNFIVSLTTVNVSDFIVMAFHFVYIVSVTLSSVLSYNLEYFKL